MPGKHVWLAALAVLVAGTMGGVVGAWAHGGTTAAQPATMTGGSFVLLDNQGIQRGVLDVSSDGTARLVVNGRNSQTPRVAIAVGADGPRITLADELGSMRAMTALDQDGTVEMGVLGFRNPTVRAGLSVTADGAAGLDLRDQHGRVRASLSLNPDGSPYIALYDENGGILWSAP